MGPPIRDNVRQVGFKPAFLQIEGSEAVGMGLKTHDVGIANGKQAYIGWRMSIAGTGADIDDFDTKVGSGKEFDRAWMMLEFLRLHRTSIAAID
jgi:hypothetical protein